MNLILFNLFKSSKLASANPPDTNEGPSWYNIDEDENPRCEGCNRLLKIHRVLIYNQPSDTQQPMPRFTTTKRCINRRCEHFHHLYGRMQASETRPSNTGANAFELVPVVILYTRTPEGNAPNRRNNSEFIPPIEE